MITLGGSKNGTRVDRELICFDNSFFDYNSMMKADVRGQSTVSSTSR